MRALANRADGHAANPVVSFRILVLPGDVIARARRQHLDVVALHEVLGEQPARILGPTENLGPVALDDERELQWGQTPFLRKS